MEQKETSLICVLTVRDTPTSAIMWNQDQRYGAPRSSRPYGSSGSYSNPGQYNNSWQYGNSGQYDSSQPYNTSGQYTNSRYNAPHPYPYGQGNVRTSGATSRFPHQRSQFTPRPAYKAPSLGLPRSIDSKPLQNTQVRLTKDRKSFNCFRNECFRTLLVHVSAICIQFHESTTGKLIG